MQVSCLVPGSRIGTFALFAGKQGQLCVGHPAWLVHRCISVAASHQCYQACQAGSCPRRCIPVSGQVLLGTCHHPARTGDGEAPDWFFHMLRLTTGRLLRQAVKTADLAAVMVSVWLCETLLAGIHAVLAAGRKLAVGLCSSHSELPHWSHMVWIAVTTDERTEQMIGQMTHCRRAPGRELVPVDFQACSVVIKESCWLLSLAELVGSLEEQVCIAKKLLLCLAGCLCRLFGDWPHLMTCSFPAPAQQR